MKTRKTLFISDIHLDFNNKFLLQNFIFFIRNHVTEEVDALFILGDLFETWVGDDECADYEEIINILREKTSSGLKIYFLHGNRDFLIGKNFLRKTGCKLLSDPHLLTLYGEKILLMHGDLLCTQDHAYLKARKKCRNRFFQFLFLCLPLKQRQKIAHRMRQQSTTYMQSATPEILDVCETTVLDRIKKHDVTYLIHGHTHRPAFHSIDKDDLKATRIVLGSWHEKANVLICDETGKKEWYQIPAQQA